LGGGEYCTSPTTAHRKGFFRAVFEVEPQSYSSLIAPVSTIPASEFKVPFASELLSKLIKQWGERWNLGDPWCEEIALLLLTYCHYSKGKALNAFDTLDRLVVLGPAKLKPLSFTHRAWEPTMSLRASFESVARTSFENALTAYCNNVERQTRASGFEPTPEKRSYEHYRWLAQHQVKGESPAQIWRSLPKGDTRSRRAVEKAIHEIAAEIGLTLR
jgi:hypothetical protein